MTSSLGSTANIDLSDAQLKLERARFHIADLDAQLDTYLSSDFYRLRLEKDNNERRWNVHFESLHKPDRTIDTVLGDAIGNLRSALDYAAVALVYPITNKTSGTGFPFADDEAGFRGQASSSRCFGHCEQRVKDYFTDVVQAFDGGAGHCFWVLNKLRNIDKHRLLVITTSLAGVSASWKVGGVTFTDCGMAVEQGKQGVFISAPAGSIEFTEQPRATFEVEFNEPEVIRGRSVSDFLSSAADQVQCLLSTLKTF
ncbi:MAG: hypothetical protein ABJH07_14255 [Sedimentitalea sp.]|uniref:hypothetical protein n=1 Tax=Sedimentitalea sp. TaxID=2048915 RepID=UPI003262E7BF